MATPCPGPAVMRPRDSPWAQGAEQINKWGLIVQTSPGSGSPEPLAGLPGRVGSSQAFVWVFKSRGHWVSPSQGGWEAGAPTQLRVWWVTGEPMEGSCLLRKHTQWEVQGEQDWPDLYVQASGRVGTWPRAGQLWPPAHSGLTASPQTPTSHSPPLQTHPTTFQHPPVVVGVWGATLTPGSMTLCLK